MENCCCFYTAVRRRSAILKNSAAAEILYNEMRSFLKEHSFLQKQDSIGHLNRQKNSISFLKIFTLQLLSKNLISLQDFFFPFQNLITKWENFEIGKKVITHGLELCLSSQYQSSNLKKNAKKAWMQLQKLFYLIALRLAKKQSMHASLCIT